MFSHANKALDREAEQAATLVRNGSSHDLPWRRRQIGSPPGGVPHARFSGAGSALPPAVRLRLESVLGANLSAVRIHTDNDSATQAIRLRARAYTCGKHIGFAKGAYDPESTDGLALLAHEATHTLQGSPDIARQEDSGLESRLSAFKQRVLNTAVKRLEENKKNLDLWKNVITEQLSSAEVRRQAYAQTPRDLFITAMQHQSVRAFNEWSSERNPYVRWVREQQAHGRYQACTGCHAEVQARAMAFEEPNIGPAWQAPYVTLGRMAAQSGELSPQRLESIRSSLGLQTTPATPSSGGLPGDIANQISPAGRSVLYSANRIGTLLAPLGDYGFRVIPPETMSLIGNVSAEELLAAIVTNIDRRQSQFSDLIARISNGDVSYLDLIPILDELLPQADKEVREAVESEKTMRSIIRVGEAALTVILSLLAFVFPPAAFAAGALMVHQGWGSMQTGYNYMLGTGAHNVFTHGQQEAAGSMMAGGAFTTGMGLFTMGMSAVPTVRWGVGAADTAATRVAVLSDRMTTSALAARAARGPIPAAELEALVQPGLAGRMAHGYLGWRGYQILYRGQGAPAAEILSPFAREGGTAASVDMYNILKANGLTDLEIAGFTSRWSANPVPEFAAPEGMAQQSLGGMGIPTSRTPGVSSHFAQTSGAQPVVYVFRVPRGMAIEVGAQGWGGAGGQAVVEGEWVILHEVAGQYIVQTIPAEQIPALVADAPPPAFDWSLTLPQAGP